MKYKYIILTAIFPIITPSTVQSAGAKIKDIDIKPIVFDSAQTENSGLGIEFYAHAVLYQSSLTNNREGDEIPEEVNLNQFSADLSLKGVISEEKENNPSDFSQLTASVQYLHVGDVQLKAGAFASIETTQDGNDKNALFGLSGTYSKFNNIFEKDIFAIQLRISTVDPSDDEKRSTIAPNKDHYQRADIEILYTYNIGTETLKTLEINYKGFYEIDPPEQIIDAGIEKHRLATYRLGLKNGMFLAYSSGELPFNEQDNQIYTIGFDYALD